MKSLIAALRDVKHNPTSVMNPSTSWVSTNRERLFCQIRNTVQAETVRPAFTFENILNIGNIFLPANFTKGLRVGFTMVLIVGVTVSSWIASVSASYDSLPGEPLYQVKLATESTELLVASVVGSDKDKITTLLKHASNRAEEYQKSKSSAQASHALKSLNSTIQTTNDSLAKSKKDSPESAADVAKVVTEKTDKILALLSDGKPQLDPLPKIV